MEPNQLRCRITVFGSSHCKYLSELDLSHNINISGVQCSFKYDHYSGKSFEDFLSPWGQEEVKKVVSDGPNYVILLFGGNSINTKVSRAYVMQNCTAFFQLVHDHDHQPKT